MEKEKCKVCGNIAVWDYMPGVDDFYCDNCVPRGCDCNVDNKAQFGFDSITEDCKVIYWDRDIYELYFKTEGNSIDILSLGTSYRTPDSFYYEILDNKGRQYPCCEYDYDINGFDIE